MTIQSMPKDQDPESADNGNDELREGFIMECEDGWICLDFNKYRDITNDSFVEHIFKHHKIKNKQVAGLFFRECKNITDATAKTIANCEQFENMRWIHLGGCCNLTDQGIIIIVNSSPQWKYFNIDRCIKLTDASIKAIVEGCPHLEELESRYVGLKSLPDDMFVKLPNLKRLSLQNNELTKLPTSITNVNNCQIMVDGNPGLPDAAKEQLDRINNSISIEAMEEMIITDDLERKDWVNLERKDWVNLEFGKCADKTNDNLVQEILDHNKIKNKQVRRIVLAECSNITDNAANIIVNSNHCTSIEGIFLYGCYNLTDKGIATIVNSNPQLKHFGFEHCNKLTNASIKAVVEGCPDLKELNAIGVGLTSLPDDMFVKLPNLKTVRLQNNKLTKLPKSITHLSEDCILELSGNPLQDPPLAVALRDGKKGILRYREDVKNGSETSNTLKTVFVGDGEAGKTSLLNLIRGKKNPRTKKEERTIHLDLVDVSVDLGSRRKLNLACYDCGGQKQYAVGQAAFLTSSALYFLCINAEERDTKKFLRFLVMLQARAPGAVVQVVLTQIDRVDKDNLEDKRDEVQREITRFKESCESSGGGRHSGHLLHIQEEIIMTSIATPRRVFSKKNNKNAICRRSRLVPTTRDDLTKVITKLITDESLLFPTLGQKIPTSWLTCKCFLNKIRDIGYKNEEALFTAVDDESVENSRDSNSPKDAFIVCMFYLAKSFIATILSFVSSWFRMSLSSSQQQTGVQEKDLYKHSIEALKKDDIDTCVCPYLNRESVTKLWEKYCQRRATANPPPKATDLQDMLTLLEAEGSIVSSKDLLFLDPSYIIALIRPLMNHSLVLETIRSKAFLQGEMRDFFDDLPESLKPTTGTAPVEKSLENFVRSGKIDGKIDSDNLLLRFLWFHLKKLQSKDYDKVFKMFREQGIVIESNFDRPEQASLEQDTSPLTERHPIFIFRLPERPTDVGKKWLTTCPAGVHHFELRIRLQAGCPDSLAVAFAAECHAFGNCLHAWVHGATVVTRERKDDNMIHAELMKPSNECEYIVFAVRTSSVSDEYSKFLCSLASTFMKKQEEYLPGLLYNIFWTCPECIKRRNAGQDQQEIQTFLWDPDRKKPENVRQLCHKCDRNVDFIESMSAVSGEDAISIFKNNTEGDAREMFRILKYLVTAVENIPRRVLDIKNIKCPYLFKFISQSDYDTHCTPSPSSTNPSITDTLSDHLDEAEKFIDKVQNGIDWLAAAAAAEAPPTLQKKKGLTKIFWKKVKTSDSMIKNKEAGNFYLQLLDGESFSPVVTYKIKVVHYSEKVKKYARVAVNMCSVGIKASVVLNKAGSIASAFGIPVLKLPKTQLEGIKTLLEKVTTADDNHSEFMKRENGGLKSGNDFDEFKTYLKELDKNNQMCKIYDEPEDETIGMNKTWGDFLIQKFTKDEEGNDRMIWVGKRNDLR